MSARVEGPRQVLAALGRIEAERQQRVSLHARLPDPVDFALACGFHRVRGVDPSRLRWTRSPNEVGCPECRAVLREFPTMADRMRIEAESEGFADQLERDQAERLEAERLERLADEQAERDAWNHDLQERGYGYGIF